MSVTVHTTHTLMFHIAVEIMKFDGLFVVVDSTYCVPGAPLDTARINARIIITYRCFSIHPINPRSLLEALTRRFRTSVGGVEQSLQSPVAVLDRVAVDFQQHIADF